MVRLLRQGTQAEERFVFCGGVDEFGLGHDEFALCAGHQVGRHLFLGVREDDYFGGVGLVVVEFAEWTGHEEYVKGS